MTTERLLPLGITRVSDTEVCAAGVTPDGRWLRPEGLDPDLVGGPASPFRFDTWSTVRLALPDAPDRRPEDRLLLAAEAGEPIDGPERAALLDSTCSASVTAAVDGVTRTAGLVRARVGGLRVRRTIGGRTILVASFTDEAGDRWDLGVLDVRAHALCGDDDAADRLLAALAGVTTYLTISLTKPEERVSRRFAGCFPLVGGIHTEPDVLATFAKGGTGAIASA